MIIDFHTHVFEENIVENRANYFDDQTFGLLYSGEKSKLVGKKTLINAMDESGVDYAVVMGFSWEKEKYCEKQNKYFSKIREFSHGRIIPFGTMPLNDKLWIKDWAQNIKESGLAGIGEVAFYNEGLTYKNAEILQEIFASALKHALPVCLHVNEPVGHEYTGKYNTDLSLLYSIIKNFPGITIILAHWGGGLFFYELMKEVNEEFTNVYYDTAASPFLYREDIFEIALKIIGPEKILFGSDYPLIKFKKYFDLMEKQIKNEQERKKILADNAAGILKDNLNIKTDS